jgi:hypothetical protein
VFNPWLNLEKLIMREPFVTFVGFCSKIRTAPRGGGSP